MKQEFILKENLQIKHGGISPDLIPGENNLFPPIVPTEIYKKPDEILNIVSSEAYKEMCLKSNPFKPYKICVSYIEQWKKEKEEEEIRLKKKNSGITDDIAYIINEFEKTMNLTKINDEKYKKYEPKVFDNIIIKDFVSCIILQIYI